MSGAIKVVKVDGEEIKKELRWLKEVLCTCYGPWGNQILLHSNTGGVVTLTKSSLKLLQLLKAENTLTSTIISHLQGHAQCYRDSTLHAGVLTCRLVLHGLELRMPRRKVAMAISHTLSLVVDWLDGACPVRHELDMCSAQQLKALLTSYLAPKMSVLSQQELQHLSSLLLKAFLRALPSEIGEGVNMSERLHLLSAPPTLHTQQTSLHEGLLLPQDMCPSPSSWFQTHPGVMLTLLFDVSLAGGPSEGSEFTMVGVASVNMDAVLEEELMSMGRGLVKRGVGLVACQKCVHPALQDYLHKEGVFVVERLGSALFPMIHGLCGGSVVSSLDSCAITQASLGTVTRVRPVQENGHRYVCLQGVSDANSTLLLCCNTERQLDELRPLVDNAGRVLECCAHDPRVLCGGGCGDTSIAHYIRVKAAECPVSDAVVMEMVAQCFEQLALALNSHGALALTDSSSHHCWFFPPVDAHSQLCDGGGDVCGGDMACNCGSLFAHEVPVDSVWSVLGTADISTLNPFLQHLKWFSSQHNANSSICSSLPIAIPTSAPPTSGPPTSGGSSSPPTSAPTTGCGSRRPPHVFDLLTPRIAALGCASDLSEIALTTAFIVTS